MAICSSSFRLSSFANLSNEFDSKKQWRSHLIVKVRAFECLRNQNREMESSSMKEVTFSSSFRYDRSSRYTVRSEKHRLGVRCMLQPQTEPETGESVITVSREGNDTVLAKDFKISETEFTPAVDNGSGGGGGGGDGNGKFGSGGGGGGGGDHEEDGKEEEEFGPIMKFEEVMKETEKRGASLPSDMLEAAKTVGIRKVLLIRYLDLQGSAWPLGAAMKSCSLLRNRMLADPAFLFKVGTEIVIDSCCATFAEVQKRGKDFWAEFELYVADLLVGIVVNVALVGLLAPYVRIGQPSVSKGFLGRMQHAYNALPSSVFEAERPGCQFSVQQRIATYFYKGILYGSVGFGCGLIGQGIANLIMTAKRSIKKSEEDIPVPPLVKSAALWGVFLAVSSNTRYQIINGLERLVEASPMAKQLPPVALAFTVGVRFANNIYGGMQFVDWARLSGCQ
ncbi:Protein of unknown function DUF3411 [Macleaya cordata]|uniref:Uncharacterized protein n=1 Tax=Macleaya cordata TaxID=56857 RepID=A0A200R4X5_MACCD|nr:Protein of unknown function DUF3411 [Macleaya cordata]